MTDRGVIGLLSGGPQVRVLPGGPDFNHLVPRYSARMRYTPMGVGTKMGTAMIIYVIGSAADGPLKIGMSANPQARVSELQTGHASRLRVWVTFHATSRQHARAVEKAVHASLRDKRSSGEWFRVTVAEAAAAIIKALGWHYENPWDDVFDSPIDSLVAQARELAMQGSVG